VRSLAFLFTALLWIAPLRAQLPSPHAIEVPPWFTESLLELRDDVREAAAQGKRTMLYFGQDGCPYCTALMQTNFSQRAIADKTRRHFVAIALNLWGDREVAWVDGRRLSEKALGRELRVQFTPTLLFLDEKGAVVLRLNGYLPPHRFEAALDYAAGLAGKGMRYDDYVRTAIREPASATLHDEDFFAGPPVRLSGAKPVALLFETPYCSGCDELHREGLKRSEVRTLLGRFDLYRLGLDDPWARKLGISYTPSIVLFDAGKEALRIEAYVRPFHLAAALDYVASGAYRGEPSFQRFVQARGERMRARGAPVDLWK
jgi:thioredoxin-related protein